LGFSIDRDADVLTSQPLAAEGDRWDNWAASGDSKMKGLVEVVIIVIVIYVAVRFFRKRG
jgi:hypothetical protein